MLCCTKQGFTLIEVLITLAIGSLLLVSLYNFYMSQKRAYALREQVAEMQQNARAGMALMVREIRMAGYDPVGTSGAGILAAGPSTIQVSMDLNGDGDTDDDNENVTYSLYDSGSDGDQDLGRKVGATNQPSAENIESLDFVYTLVDGSTTSAPVDLSQIRVVQVALTARTAKPDTAYPANNGYRTYTLKSSVTPRNLAY